jgi:hypothetical protein
MTIVWHDLFNTIDLISTSVIIQVPQAPQEIIRWLLSSGIAPYIRDMMKGTTNYGGATMYIAPEAKARDGLRAIRLNGSYAAVFWGMGLIKWFFQGWASQLVPSEMKEMQELIKCHVPGGNSPRL